MMPFQFTLYTVPLFVAALLSLGVAVYAWNRRTIPSAFSLSLLSWFVTLWSLAYALEIAGADFETKIFWGKVQYLGIVSTPVFWVTFALQQTQRTKYLTRRNIALLFVLPVITTGLAFTTERHGLIWSDIGLFQAGNLSVLEVSHGPWFWVHTAYSYLLLLSGTLLVAQTTYRSKGMLYQRQIAALLLALGAPWVGNIIYLGGWSPFPGLDLTPFSFTITTLAFAWAIFDFRLFDLAPIARERVVEGMADAMFVLNQKNQLVDLNQAARVLLGMPDGSGIIGQSAAQVFSRWPNLIARFGNVAEAQTELTVGAGEETRYFDLQITALAGDNPQQTGRLFILRDITNRKNVEIALRETENRYRTLVESLPAATYIDALDDLATTLYISPQIEQMVGFTTEEWINNPGLWAERLHPQDREQVVAANIHHNATGEPFVMEYRLIAKNGEEIWVRDEAAIVRDETGKPKWSQGVFLNITSRVQTEQALREVQLKYQSLAEQIPAVTYIDAPDETATATYISPRIETILGYPMREWENDPHFWHKVVYPEDYAVAAQLITQTLQEGQATAEYRMVAKDGRLVWIQDESVMIRNEAGQPLWVQGVMIDITERKQSEEAVKELQHRYQNLAEKIPATIYIDALDEDGSNDYISPKIESLLGYPAEVWRDDPSFWHKVVHPDDYDLAFTSIRNTIDKGSTTVEYRMVAKDGRVVWMQDEAVLIRDEQGQPLWVQGVLFDISKRKRAEATQQAFLDDMKALQEIHLTLSVIEDLDNLYIQMVSLAQAHLGFDRLGLFALDHASNQIMGTFGVGATGEIRDERYYHENITDEHWTLEIFNAPKRTKLWENAPLYDDAVEVGQGWKAATTLWNGRHAVGYMVCDNFISRKDPRPYETELLAILGSIYGHLIERKQTEELLQASEARFRQIIENASDIIYRTDIQGNFVYANPTALRTMGYHDEQEILGRNFLELCVPEEREHLREAYQNQYRTKTLNTYYEFEAITANNRTIWVGQNVQLIFDDNQVTGFQAVARNITQRKKAEAQAAERAAQLTTINQLGRAIVSTLDIPKICIATQTAVEALMPMDAFYISLYDETTREIQDVYLFDDGKVWPNSRGPLSEHGLAGKVIQSGVPLLIEDDYTPEVPLEGKVLFGAARDTRSVMVVPLIIENKIIGAISTQHYEPNKYQASHLELLELLSNQVAIALQNAQQVEELKIQAAMLDAAANAIAIIDLSGVIQWVNPAFTRLTGYTFEEAVGNTTRILRSGVHPPEFYKPLYETIMAGKIWQGELINRRKDGTHYHETQTITPVFDKEGRLFRFITIKQDLTELIQARDQALEASRLKSQLLSRVSHELRTPLGGILGYAELLQYDMFGPLNEKQKQTITQIIHSGNYLNSMVNELLDEAQLASGSLFLRIAPFSPANLMNKVEGFLSIIARQKKLLLITSVSEDLKELWGDEQRLQQILTNLIGNAIKFTQKGEVRAEIYPVNHTHWAIKVSDTGSGIPPEAQELIFEPFRQVDNAITRENRGTGLGLSITKQLVEFMSGRIFLESQIGQGSTFTVILPNQKVTEKNS